MMAKTREMLEETLCSTINNVINNEMNTQLLQIPNQISILDLYRTLFEVNAYLFSFKEN